MGKPLKMEEVQWYENLKPEINNFLWMRLPAETTLAQAEDIAMKVFNAMIEAGLEKSKNN